MLSHCAFNLHFPGDIKLSLCSCAHVILVSNENSVHILGTHTFFIYIQSKYFLLVSVLHFHFLNNVFQKAQGFEVQFNK